MDKELHEFDVDAGTLMSSSSSLGAKPVEAQPEERKVDIASMEKERQLVGDNPPVVADGEDDGEDNFVDGVTIEGEGKYQIIEVFDEVPASPIPTSTIVGSATSTSVHLEEETEIVLQNDVSPMPRPPAVVRKKFPAPALLTKAEERAVALQQMATLKVQKPRRRKQNLSMVAGGQNRDDSIQTEIVLIDKVTDGARRRNASSAASSSSDATATVAMVANVSTDKSLHQRCDDVSTTEGNNSWPGQSSNGTGEESGRIMQDLPTGSSSNFTGIRPKRIIKRKIIWDTDELKSLDYDKLLTTKYESSTISSNVVNSGGRKSLTRDAKTATLNKAKKIRQSQPKQKPETVVPEETESAEANSDSNTNDSRSINLRRRTQTTNMPKPSPRQSNISKKTKSSDFEQPDTLEDAKLNSHQGSTSRSSRKGVSATTSGSAKILRKRVKNNMEDTGDTDESQTTPRTSKNQLSISKSKQTTKLRKGAKGANEKHTAIEDAMIIRRRSETSLSSLGEDETGPQTRNRIRRKSSVNGNNTINNDVGDNLNNTATVSPANNTATNINTKATKDWALARKNIKKTGSFHSNCPRYPETLLRCVERCVKRPSSTTISELSYSSDVVVYRNGNVAQVVFNVGDKPVLKSAFTADLLGSFVDILGKMAIDNDLSAVVICSEGDDFCRGLDIGAFLKMSGVDRDNYSKNLAKYARTYLQILVTFSKPIIAAVKGETLDFGVMHLPLYDVVVCSESATFQTTYGERGQIPEAFFAWYNSHNIPTCKADLLMFGNKITAEQAKTAGMVHKLVSADRVNDEAFNLACHIGSLPHESFVLMRKYTVNYQFSRTLKLLNAEFEDILATWRCPKYLDRLRGFMRNLQS